MNFGLSEEQRLLDASVRRFLAERLPLARVRELREVEDAFDAAAWKELAASGAGVAPLGSTSGSREPNAEPRAITLSPSIFESEVIKLSVTPSQM